MAVEIINSKRFLSIASENNIRFIAKNQVNEVRALRNGFILIQTGNEKIHVRFKELEAPIMPNIQEAVKAIVEYLIEGVDNTGGGGGIGTNCDCERIIQFLQHIAEINKVINQTLNEQLRYFVRQTQAEEENIMVQREQYFEILSRTDKIIAFLDSINLKLDRGSASTPKKA